MFRWPELTGLRGGAIEARGPAARWRALPGRPQPSIITKALENHSQDLDRQGGGPGLEEYAYYSTVATIALARSKACRSAAVGPSVDGPALFIDRNPLYPLSLRI